MLDHEKFLSPKKSNIKFWNKLCIADMDFFEAQNKIFFLSRAEGGVMPEKVLCKFTHDRADTLFGCSTANVKDEVNIPS